MGERLKRSFIFIMLFFLGIAWLCVDIKAEDFYVNLLKEGEAFYKEGNYELAIKNFKIAEFGLIEDRENLIELYLFYSLSHFKMGRIEETKKIVDKFKKNLNINDLSYLEVPQSIKDDFQILISTLFKTKGIKKRGSQKIQLNKIYEFESIFRDTLENLKHNKLKEVEKNIKRLKKIDKKDLRIQYLNGYIAFQKKKYDSCISLLIKIYDSIEPEYKDDVFYYLTLSNYYAGNYGQTLAFFQKISKKEVQLQLNGIIKKVIQKRENIINQIAVNTSDKNLLKKAVKEFVGDQFLFSDILKKALNMNRNNCDEIINMVNQSVKISKTYNLEFILNTIDYLEQENRIEQAIEIMKKSKFYKTYNKENLEFYYRLAQIYFKNKNFKKAMSQFLKVDKLKKKYKKTDYYIDKINNI